MKDLFNLFKKIVPKKSPKYELNFAFYDAKNKKLVATDTKQLFIVDVELNLDQNCLIDINHLGSNYKLIGSINGTCCYNATKKTEYRNTIYPDYKKVIQKDFNLIVEPNYSYIDNIWSNVGSILNREIYIDCRIYNKLKNTIEDPILGWNNNDLQVQLSGKILTKYEKYNFKHIIMPLSIIETKTIKGER